MEPLNVHSVVKTGRIGLLSWGSLRLRQHSGGTVLVAGGWCQFHSKGNHHSGVDASLLFLFRHIDLQKHTILDWWTQFSPSIWDPLVTSLWRQNRTGITPSSIAPRLSLLQKRTGPIRNAPPPYSFPGMLLRSKQIVTASATLALKWLLRLLWMICRWMKPIGWVFSTAPMRCSWLRVLRKRPIQMGEFIVIMGKQLSDSTTIRLSV